MVIIINYPPPTEGLHHVEPNVTAYFQNNSIGKGTLYIAESVFCWIANSGEGFSLKYQDIFIHAVSRDLSYFPEECLYLMIDGNINLNPEEEHQEVASALNNLSVEENEDDNDDEEEDSPSEMRFVPDNRNMLDVMFQALSDCQALNPDQEERSDDDDDAVIAPSFTIHEGNGFVDEDYGAGGDQEYVEEEMNEEQFEDAEQ